jgi:predicted nucleic acid-binding protein
VVIPLDAEVCRVYARARAALPAGVTVAPNDLWIAACALRHAMPLLTNHRRHFEQIGGLDLPHFG